MKTLPLPNSFLNLRHLPPFSNVNSFNNLLLCRHSSPLIRRRRCRTLTIQSMAASTSSDLNQDNSVSTAADVNNDIFQLIQAHQNKASRLTPVQEVKTFLCHSLRGVISTVSMCIVNLDATEARGYPSGSMVDFACDAYGAPILAVSDLAVHTKNLMANPKCSLLVSKDPQDRTELVVTVHGDAVPVPEKQREEIRAMYLGQHPNAFWVDFGDFQFLRIEPKVIQYVSGVAAAFLGSGEFSIEEFRTAVVDPIHQFSKPITSHMNKDHTEDTKLMVQHSTFIPVDFAQMLDVDSLGFNVKADCQGNTFKLRIPFPRRAADRKDVKALIVEMLQAAKASKAT